MHEAVEPPRDVGSIVAAIYAPIRDDLKRVEEILQRHLRADDPFVDQMVRHCATLGGKRLRPALVLLVAQAVGRVEPEHHVVAAVLEMIHTATLVHDDVLDEASVRRHRPTANAQWDNKASVLLGDFLFTHAFYLASTLDSTFACRTIGQSTNIVCEGELRQVGSRGRFDVDEAEYLAMIEAKTAELCACCCRLGAHYAGAEAALTDTLSEYGRLFGIAFQITDDLLDMLGDEHATGKSLGTDLEQLKPTLPLIRLLQQLEPDQRQCLEEGLLAPDADRRTVLNLWLGQSDALQYSRQRAIDYAEAAREQLKPLAASPARDVLHKLCDFVIERNA